MTTMQPIAIVSEETLFFRDPQSKKALMPAPSAATNFAKIFNKLPLKLMNLNSKYLFCFNSRNFYKSIKISPQEFPTQIPKVIPTTLKISTLLMNGLYDYNATNSNSE